MIFPSIYGTEASLHETTHVGSECPSCSYALYDTISLLLKFKHLWLHMQDE